MQGPYVMAIYDVYTVYYTCMYENLDIYIYMYTHTYTYTYTYTYSYINKYIYIYTYIYNTHGNTVILESIKYGNAPKILTKMGMCFHQRNFYLLHGSVAKNIMS